MTLAVSPTVETELKNNIGIITISNPAKRNALCKSLLCQLNCALDEFQNEKIPVIILRAAPGVKV
jgi:enoyl-CoA hydratase/carnithine racemase